MPSIGRWTFFLSFPTFVSVPLLGPQVIPDLTEFVSPRWVKGQHLSYQGEREAVNSVPGGNLVPLVDPVREGLLVRQRTIPRKFCKKDGKKKYVKYILTENKIGVKDKLIFSGIPRTP